jgi:ATP-binding cassette subfamily B multidrug efflux pump
MPSNNIKTNRRVGQGHGPNRVVEKPKNFKKAVKEIINYCKPYMFVIIIALLLAAFSSIFTILGPNKLRDLTNEIVKGIMTGINFTNVKNITVYLVVLYGLSFVFNYLQGFIMATVTNKFSKRIRKEIINKVNNLPLKYFDKHSYGDLLSRITNDVDTLGTTLYNSVAPLVSALTLFIGTLYMMFRTNYQMAFTSVGATLIGFILMIIILSKSQKYFVMQQKELGNINGHIEEIYSGHNIVKVYNGINEANNKFDSINERLYKSAKNSQFLSGLMQPIMSFIGNFGYVAVCVVGASLVLNNTITIGTIVAFMIYIRLFSQPLGQIAQAMNQLQSAAAASERVFEFLGEKEMPKEDIKVVLDSKEVKGNIEFKNVKFGYDEDKVIIKDFNAKVKSGEKVAIVGPTGAGKTTMVNLLMKFYDINSGDILIDGISINDLSRENIHDLFIMVLQDTWLFNGSVKENIVFNKENVSDEEIDEACKTVGIDHFVKTLPHNYETILSDSESISAGQKQLLTIARGMIKNAPFLILDEATSSVDTRTEELVQKAMDKLTEGRTSFIIAHRLSTIKNADLILVMNEGNIIEQGTHGELLKKNGFYANLYNSQFEKVE